MMTVTVAPAAVMALFLALLTAATPTTSTDGLSGPHNITDGNKSSSDHHLYQGVSRVNSSAVSSVQVNETCYPHVPAHVTPHSRISSFTVLDLMPAGEGGYPQVLSGGVGHPQVCVRLSTQPHKPYHFMIDVWGTYTDNESLD